MYYEPLENGDIDIDVRLFKRENLPEAVRPNMNKSSYHQSIPAPTDLIDSLAGPPSALYGGASHAPAADQIHQSYQPNGRMPGANNDTARLGQRRSFNQMQQSQGYDQPDRDQIAAADTNNLNIDDVEDYEEVNNTNNHYQ